MYKFRIFFVLEIAVIICCTTNFTFASNSLYVWSPNEATSPTSTVATESVGDNANSLNLLSKSAILIEQTTGKVLYEHNIHEQLRPASVTKLMSILIIMEQIESGKLLYEDNISCSENASHMGGSQIWLDTTETLTVDEMLKAICVVSANDCVVAMAEHIAGSESAFVELMNNKAKELGMNDTTFKNCHGIDEDGHVTSAYDISIMSKELLNKYPQITKYTTIWMDNLRDGKSELVNTNKLIRNYKGATGLKTGSTSLALYNLSASATRDGLNLIAVIMKAPSSKIRFEEAEKLLDYGFNNFEFKILAKKGEKFKDINVHKGTYPNVGVLFEENVGVLIEKGQEKNIVQNITIEDTIISPVEKGQKMGEVTYNLNDEQLAKVNLVSEISIDRINILNMCKKIYLKWFNLLR